MLSYKKISPIGDMLMNAAEAIKAQKAANTLNKLGYYPEIRVNIAPKMGMFSPLKTLRTKKNNRFFFKNITPSYLV